MALISPAKPSESSKRRRSVNIGNIGQSDGCLRHGMPWVSFEFIIDNPMKWDEDENNPKNLMIKRNIKGL
jgi:hypothetical protein